MVIYRGVALANILPRVISSLRAAVAHLPPQQYFWYQQLFL